MFTHSIWNDFADETQFPPLKKDIEVDTAIIGGGITGISTAAKLAGKGQKVAVLEALKVGGGTTAHSTGNLYSTIDKNLDILRSKYDTETISRVLKSRAYAVDQIEKYTQRYELDADFSRRPWYLYSAAEENNSLIQKELDAGDEMGLEVTTFGTNEIPFPASRAVKVPGQAQINPMRYVQGLAKQIESENCSIFEWTRVVETRKKDDYTHVLTSKQNTVIARQVVHATHTPKGIKFVQTMLGPYREYGIGCRIEPQNSHPEGIFWGYYGSKEKFSTRTYSRDGEHFLLVIGKPHKVGQAKSNVRQIQQLEEFANLHFDVTEVTHRWGGQHYRPADLLPYIGRQTKGSETFIATGFSTDGLVYGTLAADIIADEIMGMDNSWADLYKPYRHQPVKAAKKFVKENLNVAKQYLDKLPSLGPDDVAENVSPGEAQIVEKEGQKLAVYNDEDGNLQICSAICPHMACIVHWNNAERSWDCPCHGSRFKPDGTVLEGPSFHPLRTIEIHSLKEK